MEEKFIVKPKRLGKSIYEPVNTSIRIEKALLDSYEDLANRTGYSRNEVMCMALRYALENVELVES